MTFGPGGPADGAREVVRESPSPSHLDHGLGVLELGLGNYQTACQLLQRAVSGPHPGIAIVAPDLLEASVRCGRKRAAAVLLQRLVVRQRDLGRASGPDLEALLEEKLQLKRQMTGW